MTLCYHTCRLQTAMGPNKLLDNVSTVPMKVCNGIMHGNRRSHAILSPGVVGATASHTIECMLIMINEVLEVHGAMSEEYTLQCDGASTNKNVLVLTFWIYFVMQGVLWMPSKRSMLEWQSATRSSTWTR